MKNITELQLTQGVNIMVFFIQQENIFVRKTVAKYLALNAKCLKNQATSHFTFSIPVQMSLHFSSYKFILWDLQQTESELNKNFDFDCFFSRKS